MINKFDFSDIEVPKMTLITSNSIKIYMKVNTELDTITCVLGTWNQ